ncbi:MAG TPA: glycerol-3-phosphate 1-O-acyltransferase PlsY [Anaerolineae bacterium]|nr:glycerol-3-phosphate 1-O-acyltransferase PlsY [Anaerolineae bacterium]HNU03996.1 glycerol-3-phosphate 1-O-acyltransferase PlsY [Anaerolineae bacterium]
MNLANLTVSILIGYLIGSLPIGYLLGRLKGIDVRTIGSGRTGGTNVYRALGARLGLLTGVLDFAKGAVPVLLMRSLFGDDVAAALAGAAAVAGHNWSLFLGFKGGAGGSTAAGALLALNPLAGAIVVPIFVLILFIGRIASVATLWVGAGSVVAILLLHLINPAATPLSQLFFALPAMVMIAISLRPNIERLLNGTERRIDFKHKAGAP